MENITTMAIKATEYACYIEAITRFYQENRYMSREEFYIITGIRTKEEERCANTVAE